MTVFMRRHAVYFSEGTGKMLAVVKSCLHGNVDYGKVCGIEQIGGVVAAYSLDIFHDAAIQMRGKQLSQIGAADLCMCGDFFQSEGLLEILLDIVACDCQILDARRTVMGMEGAGQSDEKFLEESGQHRVAFRLIVFPFI